MGLWNMLSTTHSTPTAKIIKLTASMSYLPKPQGEMAIGVRLSLLMNNARIAIEIAERQFAIAHVVPTAPHHLPPLFSTHAHTASPIRHSPRLSTCGAYNAVPIAHSTGGNNQTIFICRLP